MDRAADGRRRSAFAFRIWQRKLLNNEVILVKVKLFCSNFWFRRQTAKASFGQVETDGFSKAGVDDIAHAMRAAAEVPSFYFISSFNKK